MGTSGEAQDPEFWGQTDVGLNPDLWVPGCSPCAAGFTSLSLVLSSGQHTNNPHLQALSDEVKHYTEPGVGIWGTCKD